MNIFKRNGKQFNISLCESIYINETESKFVNKTDYVLQINAHLGQFCNLTMKKSIDLNQNE